MAISFDGAGRIIALTAGTTALSVRALWSRWVDWTLMADNSKYLPAMSLLGGDDIDPTAGTKVPVYVSLLNNWRVQPQAANHTLVVSDGVLLVAGGGDPFVTPLGNHTIRVVYQQPVQAIGFSAGGGIGPTAAQIVAALMAEEIAPGLSLRRKLRNDAAVLTGQHVVAGTTERFVEPGGTAVLVEATVTSTGRAPTVWRD